MSRRALLLIDFFNPSGFGSGGYGRAALQAASRAAALKARCRRARIPAIYANDNFGRWQSEFSTLMADCVRCGGVSKDIVGLLAPQQGDVSILKPRHSAFYGTPLEFLLDELGVGTLILTGVATDACISVTALDAHIRRYRVWVPGDCVAAQEMQHTRTALRSLARNAHASIVASRRPLPA